MRCPISMNVPPYTYEPARQNRRNTATSSMELPDTDRLLCARSAVDTRLVDVPASRVDLVTVFLGMTAHRRFVT
jgi:hypothetical protein